MFTSIPGWRYNINAIKTLLDADMKVSIYNIEIKNVNEVISAINTHREKQASLKKQAEERKTEQERKEKELAESEKEKSKAEKEKITKDFTMTIDNYSDVLTEKIHEYISEKDSWTAWKAQKHTGVVIVYETPDNIRTILYTDIKTKSAIEHERVENEIKNPSSYLIETIIKNMSISEGKHVTDYSNCYTTKHYKIIAENPELSKIAIENYKKLMLINKKGYWSNNNRKCCEFLGIQEEVERLWKK